MSLGLRTGVSHTDGAGAASSDVDDGGGVRPGEAHAERAPHDLKGAGRPSSSWRIEPSSPPATWTIEEYTIGDLVSVRPYRGSFEPIGVAHPVTSHIEPLAAQARPVRSRGHRVKHDSRMLDRPPRPVGAVNVFILDTRRASSGSPTTPGGRLMRAHLMLDSGSVAYRTVTGAEWSRS